MKLESPVRELHRLARLYGVQTVYKGVRGMRQNASVASLLAVLRSLGAPFESAGQVHDALRWREQQLRETVIQPVCVAWDDDPPSMTVCLPAKSADVACSGLVRTEAGEAIEWQWRLADLPDASTEEYHDGKYICKCLTLPVSLPHGYHDFTLKTGGKRYYARIICAPGKTYEPPGQRDERAWGAFLPLYALETASTMGSGDYTALGELAEKTGQWGGSLVGTLPLMPVFLDEPYDHGPYSPASRLLWNEFYVDVAAAPELEGCEAARRILESADFKAEANRLRSLDKVDYRGVMGLKRRVLEVLSKSVMASAGKPMVGLYQFALENPYAADYAAFRAVMRKSGKTWHGWPQRLRDGTIKESDFKPADRDYFLYAQWLAHRQVEALSARAEKNGVTMYFDLPLGVNGASYDVWRNRGSFALSASTGAPPDAVFTSGQNWGFPPLHPDRIREDGYKYFIAYLRHQMRHAGMLRIDHVMGMHRLFWIPHEMNAAGGVYVKYHPEEMYAIVTLESHRNKCVVVGEDLGIVPGAVRRSMSRHGLQRMFITQYQMMDEDGQGVERIPRNMVAAMNTHDMPPFATFWKGTDIGLRESLGLVGDEVAAREKKERPALRKALTAFLKKQGLISSLKAPVRDILSGCLAYMSSSAARVVLVNLEDLWLETRPQNVPGTVDEHPNWRYKARYKLEEMDSHREVREILQDIDARRKNPTGS